MSRTGERRRRQGPQHNEDDGEKPADGMQDEVRLRVRDEDCRQRTAVVSERRKEEVGDDADERQ